MLVWMIMIDSYMIDDGWWIVDFKIEACSCKMMMIRMMSDEIMNLCK